MARMRFLGPWDYAVFALYFAVLIGIGAWFRKKAALARGLLPGRPQDSVVGPLGLSQMTFSSRPSRPLGTGLIFTRTFISW